MIGSGDVFEHGHLLPCFRNLRVYVANFDAEISLCGSSLRPGMKGKNIICMFHICRNLTLEVEAFTGNHPMLEL